jgi:hypothetical protein
VNRIAPRVIILNGNEVVTGAGATVPAPPGGPAPKVLSRLAGALRDNGQVLITSEPGWDHLTDPDMKGDWTLSGGPGWHTARNGNTRLRIGRIGDIKKGNSPILDTSADLISMAVRHQMFADLVGVPFYGDGGTVALTLLDQVSRVRGREPLRKWLDDKAPRVREDGWPGSPPWTAPGTDGTGPLVVDRNAQYLAGVTGVYLPLDAPEHSGPIEHDARRAGLWHIITPDNPEPRLPHPCGNNAKPGEPRWVAHPTAELLAEHGPVKVLDSWTLDRARCRRILDPWYDTLRRARNELVEAADPDSAALLQAVKDTYSRGISHLDKAPERRWYRPDWRAALYASARTRMWRALYRTGITDDYWPVAIATDQAVYPTLKAGAGLKIGTGIGEWKVK